MSDGILSRAQDEITGSDYALAIVFAATAVECELSQLFVKWRRIDTTLAGSQADDTSLEEELRRQSRIREKLDGVAQLLVAKNLDEFVAGSAGTMTGISRALGAEFLIPSLLQNVEQRLFWKRNQILHFGRMDYEKADADDCLQIAAAMMQTYRNMDFERRKQLDAS